MSSASLDGQRLLVLSWPVGISVWIDREAQWMMKCWPRRRRLRNRNQTGPILRLALKLLATKLLPLLRRSSLACLLSCSWKTDQQPQLTPSN